jgi:hypothetical protein
MEIDLRNAFNSFASTNRGESLLDYDHFMKAVIGPMAVQRLSYVRKAFDTLDYTQLGIIEVPPF